MSNFNALGLEKLNARQYAEAIVCFNKALTEINPESDRIYPLLLFNLGNAYAGTRQYFLAIEQYLNSLIYAPQFDLTRKHLVECLNRCIGISESAEPHLPNIAELLIKFKDKMGWWDVLENPSSIKKFLHLLNAARQCNKQSILLDISAGCGHYKDFFAHTNYISIDLAVAETWSYAELDLMGDALNLPIKENSVDVIISSSSLEHYSDPFAAFREFTRVLKPAGHLYLDVPFTHVEHQIPHDYFRFSRYGLKHLCQLNQLDIVTLQPDCGFAMTGFRMLNEALTGIRNRVVENRMAYNTISESIRYLDETLKPILREIDPYCYKSGVDEDILDCTQYPVRYNLVAIKPGVKPPEVIYSDKKELLADMAECPHCHRSKLVWLEQYCHCPACNTDYPRTIHGVPQLTATPVMSSASEG